MAIKTQIHHQQTMKKYNNKNTKDENKKENSSETKKKKLLNIKYNIRLKTRSLKISRSRTSKLEVTKKTLQKQKQHSKP
jgi:hypothetical protein